MILDLFAGPGGWSEGLRLLGSADVGIEHDMAACRTRTAAGHLTIRADVSSYPTSPFIGKVEGLIASPPCPTFSTAGKGEGVDDMPHLLSFIVGYAKHGWVDPLAHHQWADKRTPLILEPLRWVGNLGPEWVALEQVPPCLPIWQAIADVWSAAGYRTWTGVLNAADFGVPQTRKRAFCIAHRTRAAHPPEPTHDRDPQPSLFGPQLEPWVSMASALGWGMTQRPFLTMAPGHEPALVGGSAARESIERERERGRWLPPQPRGGPVETSR